MGTHAGFAAMTNAREYDNPNNVDFEQKVLTFLAGFIWTKDNAGMSGNIPAAIGGFRSLESLDMTNTSLSGPIPPELGNLNPSTISTFVWVNM